MRRGSIVLSVLVVALIGVAFADDGVIYTCVDSQGAWTYQEGLPPARLQQRIGRAPMSIPTRPCQCDVQQPRDYLLHRLGPELIRVLLAVAHNTSVVAINYGARMSMKGWPVQLA